MKTKLLVFVLVFASCVFKTATAQTVTSVAGLDFGTEYDKAKNYLANHFGWNNYATKGNYMLRFSDVIVGGITYENAEFYFKNKKFVAARFYTGFALSQLNAANHFESKYFRDIKRNIRGPINRTLLRDFNATHSEILCTLRLVVVTIRYM